MLVIKNEIEDIIFNACKNKVDLNKSAENWCRDNKIEILFTKKLLENRISFFNKFKDNSIKISFNSIPEIIKQCLRIKHTY